MRRRDREVVEFQEILQVIDRARVMRLGLNDAGRVYIVPMNFGWRLEKGAPVFYLHSARQGRKIDILQINPQVGFELDGAHHLIEANAPCGYGFAFESVVGTGRISFLEEPEEKRQALAILMRHQCGREISFEGKAVDSVAVLRLAPEEYACKRRPMEI